MGVAGAYEVGDHRGVGRDGEPGVSESGDEPHYRVTLTAPRGYEPCELAGSPTGLRFSHDGTDSGITAGRHGNQRTAVAFGPGRPVHFDIQVPSGGPGTTADEAAFALRAPDGEIPGTSYAEGTLTVAAGPLVGPVRSGAWPRARERPSPRRSVAPAAGVSARSGCPP